MLFKINLLCDVLILIEIYLSNKKFIKKQQKKRV